MVTFLVTFLVTSGQFEYSDRRPQHRRCDHKCGHNSGHISGHNGGRWGQACRRPRASKGNTFSTCQWKCCTVSFYNDFQMVHRTTTDKCPHSYDIAHVFDIPVRNWSLGSETFAIDKHYLSLAHIKQILLPGVDQANIYSLIWNGQLFLTVRAERLCCPVLFCVPGQRNHPATRAESLAFLVPAVSGALLLDYLIKHASDLARRGLWAGLVFVRLLFLSRDKNTRSPRSK